MNVIRKANDFVHQYWPVLFGIILSINTAVLSYSFLQINERADQIAKSQRCANLASQINSVYGRSEAQFIDFTRQILLAESREEVAALKQKAKDDGNLRPLADILKETQDLQNELKNNPACKIVVVPEGASLSD